MTMRGVRYLVAVAVLWPMLAWAQAAPTASLDRPRVGLGETVTLNIQIGDGDADAPDLSPLSADFVVLGTSTNHTLSIVNGHREAHTILGVALRPRREGHLTVPALAIGAQKTPPLDLDVEAPGKTAGTANPDAPVQLEDMVNPTHAYVGQQIDYTLRLYFTNLADGNLGDPAADGAEVRRVGQDANYQTTRGNRRLNVVERHYAIFPQRPGTLDIQPPTFQGTVVDPNDMDAFFGSGSPVSTVGQPLRVEVRGRPSGAADGAWIPARSLSLSLDGLPADGKATVGQPVTLTMRLEAVGMPFEALPALSLPTLDGADVYPDKAATGGSTSGPWITGRRQQAFAVVPTRPGTLHIPETTLHWWNVVTDKPEEATIPAHDIQVAPGSGAPAKATPPRAPATGASPSASPAAAPVAGARSPWLWGFAALAVLWIATLLGWWLTWRRRGAREPVAPAPSGSAMPVREGATRDAFLRATGHADAQTVERALLAWARTYHPAIRSLGALSPLLREGPQRDAIATLQRARFAGGTWQGGMLKDAFARGFDWKPADGADHGPLPPLYPR